MNENKTIVVGVTGGIAAYKAAGLVSALKKRGLNVQVIMTRNAAEFVAPLTFETLSNNPVAIDMFSRETPWEVEHISLAKAADVFVIVPASADIIGKIAHGIADDMLTTTVMATKAPVVIAPAMNTNMYLNPIVQDNIKKLRGFGYFFVEPGSGALACGDIGLGRLADESVIEEAVLSALRLNKDLAGKSVLITAGPTREPIDPIRYISNRSSGKMGYALAKMALRRGARVTLISGPVGIAPPAGVNLISINTTRDMLEAVLNEYKKHDIVIKAAAPADYALKDAAKHKIKKTESELALKLDINPDIAEELGKLKTNQFIVIFAAETDDAYKNGVDKLERKNADLIVINDVSEKGAGFECDTNIVTIVDRAGAAERLPIMSKDDVADRILSAVVQRLS